MRARLCAFAWPFCLPYPFEHKQQQQPVKVQYGIQTLWHYWVLLFRPWQMLYHQMRLSYLFCSVEYLILIKCDYTGRDTYGCTGPSSVGPNNEDVIPHFICSSLMGRMGVGLGFACLFIWCNASATNPTPDCDHHQMWKLDEFSRPDRQIENGIWQGKKVRERPCLWCFV